MGRACGRKTQDRNRKILSVLNLQPTKNMYPIEVIKSESYQTPPAIKDNWNRESSACFSSKGAVVHSGVFRSTAFIPADTELYADLKYWIKQGQTELDAFIDAIIGDCSDEHANKSACQSTRPEWKFSKRGGRALDRCIQAKRRTGKLVELQESTSWKAIHFLTK